MASGVCECVAPNWRPPPPTAAPPKPTPKTRNAPAAQLAQAEDRDEDRAQQEQLYAETVTWYRRYGVSDRAVPPTLDAFWERFDDVCRNELERIDLRTDTRQPLPAPPVELVYSVDIAPNGHEAVLSLARQTNVHATIAHVVGVEFGTLSGRALVVRVEDGHVGVEHRLPGRDGCRLGRDERGGRSGEGRGRSGDHSGGASHDHCQGGQPHDQPARPGRRPPPGGRPRSPRSGMDGPTLGCGRHIGHANPRIRLGTI